MLFILIVILDCRIHYTVPAMYYHVVNVKPSSSHVWSCSRGERGRREKVHVCSLEERTPHRDRVVKSEERGHHTPPTHINHRGDRDAPSTEVSELAADSVSLGSAR